MSDGCFDNRKPQYLYFTLDDDSGHNYVFKVISRILQERDINISDLKNEYEDFNCVDNSVCCCMQGVLGNQVDFVNIKSLLKIH